MSEVRAEVLVIDDQEYVRESLVALLERQGHAPCAAASAEEAFELLAARPVDAVVTDLQMPGDDGLTVVRELAASTPHLPVIVLTGHGTVASAVACVQAGAFDYLEKPADPDALAVTVRRALAWARAQRQLEAQRRSDEVEEGPVGESPEWRAVMELVDTAARADSSVLLLGESGSGKDLLAREIHGRSRRAEEPFVAVNCGAIPMELFESEFFGHVKGAFTGAAADRDGRFSLAHRGTLFLDELGNMPMAAQAKLLRVLQDGRYERVGDARSLSADVRIVAATNVDLEKEVEEGRLRKDLLYRLDVIRIEVPPLRRRRADLPLLAAHFLPRCAQRAGRSIEGITPEALRLLTEYDWPGNVRELQNVLERAVVIEKSDRLTPASLPFGKREGGAESPLGDDLNLREVVKRAERQALREALRRADGVRADAARLLGIDPRNLSYYLRKHGL